MFTVSKKIINPPQKFANKILGANIDLPKTGTTNEVEQVIIAGWVLPRDEKEAQIIIEGNGREQTFSCDIQRDDVTKTILGEINPNIKCGFRIKWPHTGIFKISFVVEGEKMLIAEIQIRTIFSQINNSTGLLDSYWQAFHSLDRQKLSGFDSESLKSALQNSNYKDKFRSAFLTLDMKEINIVANLFTDHGLEFSEARYNEFINFVVNPTFSIDIIGQAVTSGVAKIPSPFSSNNSSSCKSIVVGEVNFLLFRDGPNCFYVAQFCNQIALIFPQIYCALSIPQVKYWFEYATSRMYDLLECLVDNFKFIQENDFKPSIYSGLFIAQCRPYHYYTDYMYGLYLAYGKGLVNESTNIYTLEGGNFLSISDLYSLKEKDNVCKYQDINRKLFKNREFIIIPSVQYLCYKKPDILSDLDERIINKFLCSASESNELDNLLKSAKECYPLLWFGVTVQKRSWVEQIEGGAKIITELAKLYPNLGVVFDGWTSPLNPTKGDLAEAGRDQAIVDQIIQLLPQQVKTFSLVGATSVRKLAFATIIDAFIANSLTGSIHVDRFARKPGVGHISKQAIPLASYQIAPIGNIITVPSDKITDISNPHNPDPSWLSYSIDPDVILNMVKEILNENT